MQAPPVFRNFAYSPSRHFPVRERCRPDDQGEKLNSPPGRLINCQLCVRSFENLMRSPGPSPSQSRRAGSPEKKVGEVLIPEIVHSYLLCARARTHSHFSRTPRKALLTSLYGSELYVAKTLVNPAKYVLFNIGFFPFKRSPP